MKNILISLCLTLLLSSLAYYKKAITNSGLLLSAICCFIISLFGGFPCFVILLVTFLGASLAEVISKNNKIKININEKCGQRDIIQIVVNVLPATIAIIIFHFTNNNIFLMGYVAMMGETLADTLGSDIGIISKKKPINILTFKRSQPGLSGNVTFLGLCCELGGSLMIGLIYYLLINNNIIDMLIITSSSLMGGLFDSVLGALGQVKYKCQKCKMITEKKMHCGYKTEYYKGIRWIDNDIVNLFSNLFSLIVLIVLNLIR